MDSRERVLTALRHSEPDRVPYDLSSTPVTGIHRIAYAGLRQALGLPERDPVIWHQMQQLAWVDDDVHAVMETDVKGLRPKSASTWTPQERQDDTYLYFTDEWGAERRMLRDNGYYYDLCASPLANATSPRDIEAHAWPDPTNVGRLDGLRDLALQAQGQGRAFILGGICAGMLEMGQWLLPNVFVRTSQCRRLTGGFIILRQMLSHRQQSSFDITKLEAPCSRAEDVEADQAQR